MDLFIDLLKILGPAAIVLYASFLMVSSLLKARFDELQSSLKQKIQKEMLPIKLQAYERIVLLLERSNPNNLIPRLSQKEMNATVLQHLLIKEIRQEFNHNLSQQIYLTNEAWSYITASIEDTITLINEAAMGMDEEHSGLDLAKLILEGAVKKNSIQQAIVFVKDEIKELF
ncbi:MAG: hypothetical protein CMB82_06965 [Flammeovirgaceae bacterium]|nr:hypothetical protein [Flammeovirgaceae bacterium]|tara:strand:- start:908 stop:1423 length:516 start_codon:yes stop_codon:yes gene_type:complete